MTCFKSTLYTELLKKETSKQYVSDSQPISNLEKKKKTHQVEQRIYLNSNKQSFNLLLQLFHKQCRNLVLSPRTLKYNFMLLWLHEYVQMLSLETNQINNLILPCAKYSIIKRQKLIGKEKRSQSWLLRTICVGGYG